MKRAKLAILLALSAVITASAALAKPSSGNATSLQGSYPYRVVDLGTFGGPNGEQNYPGQSLLNDGTAIG